jgi:tetratricopeptide (TPR) repeat protein
LEGNSVNLEDYRPGPLAIVSFWALWSPKSVALLQDLQKLFAEFEGNGLEVLGVNSEGQNAPADLEEQVKALVQEHGLTFPVVFDKGLEQYNVWGVIATPATAFLGKDLEVGYEFSGHPTSAYEDMREEVMKTLGIAEELAEASKPKRERYKASKRVSLNYGMCNTLYGRGQFSKAERTLRKVLKQDPQFPDAHALNGAINLGLERGGRSGAAEKARAAFEKAVELDDTVPLGLAGLAHFALVDGDVPKALELTRRAAEFTEPEALPSLKEAGTEASEEASTEEQKSEETEASSKVFAQLDQAATALEGGNADEAKALVDQVVEGLLNLPNGPKMNAKGKMMLDRVKKSQ